MSSSLEISSRSGTYSVDIRQGAATDLLAKHPDAHVIADEILKPLLAGRQGIPLKASIENKDYEAIAGILKQLRELKLASTGSIVAVGGGTIQDIAGFAASIYMHGVKWYYAPTTLLGMVDACIGSKASVNVRGVQDLAGTVHPPAGVFIDPAFISTLSMEHKVSGLCMAAKTCFAHTDRKTFASYLELKPLEKELSTTYEAVIFKSLQAKKWFVEIDEFDQNERLLLHFGHNFGHAIEIASNHTLSYGVAIGLGMLCALEFQTISERGYTAHERVVTLRQHVESLIARVPEIKAAIKKLRSDAMMATFRADQEHPANEYALIVPDPRGTLVRKRIPRNDLSDGYIRQALQKVITTYG